MPKGLTKEEAEIFVRNFPAFVEETRKNFSQLFTDRENDAKLWEDIYKAVGALRSETHLSINKVEEAKNKIEKSNLVVTEAVTAGMDDLNETLQDQPVVIVKQNLTFTERIRKIFLRGKNAKDIPN